MQLCKLRESLPWIRFNFTDDARFLSNLTDPPDFVLCIGDYEWSVHSKVFIDKSPFFKTLMEGDFKVANLILLQCNEANLSYRRPLIAEQS